MSREGKRMLRPTDTIRLALSGAAVVLLSAPVWAQETPAEEPAQTPEEAAATAREEAVKTVPAWKPYGSDDGESMEETFFRLAQDFVTTSEIGVRRLGHVPIWPRGELKVGRMRIFPYIREGAEYESNYFNERVTGRDPAAPANGRKGSYVWTNTAGLMGDALFMNGRLRISASAEGNWDFRAERNQEDTFELDTQLGAAYTFPSGVWIRGGYAYEKRTDAVEVEQTGEFQRTNSRLFLYWGLNRDILFGSKARFDMGVTVRNVDPKDDDALGSVDRTETEYYLKASYPFWKQTTRVFGRVTYRDDNREASTLNDGEVYGFDAGIEGNFPIMQGETRGLRGTMSVGFDHALYENDDFVDDGVRFQRDDDDRHTNVSLSMALQYVMSSRQSVDLRLIRTNQFSVRSNFQVTDRADLAYSHNITPRLVGRASAFVEHSNPSGETPPLAPDVRFAPDDPNRIRSPNRNINRGGVGLGLRYRLTDWADLDASWDYTRRNERSENSYTNHRVGLGVTLYMSGIRPKRKRTRTW